MKIKDNYLNLKMALILSSDINLNPGLVTRCQIKDQKFKVCNSKGPLFLHLNINSLLAKISEPRYITKCFNEAVIGMTGITVYNSEFAVDGCSILPNDRNRKG